jgi:hypothetical protein
LIISNHRSDIDWLIGWICAQVAASLLVDWLLEFSFLFIAAHNDQSNLF